MTYNCFLKLVRRTCQISHTLPSLSSNLQQSFLPYVVITKICHPKQIYIFPKSVSFSLLFLKVYVYFLGCSFGCQSLKKLWSVSYDIPTLTEDANTSTQNRYINYRTLSPSINMINHRTSSSSIVHICKLHFPYLSTI